jgi:hypothetical protein
VIAITLGTVRGAEGRAMPLDAALALAEEELGAGADDA